MKYPFSRILRMTPRGIVLLSGLIVLLAMLSISPTFGFRTLRGSQQGFTPASDPFLARFFAAEGVVQANWEAVRKARSSVMQDGWEKGNASIHLLRPYDDLSWDGSDYAMSYAGKYNWWKAERKYSGPTYDRLSGLLGENGTGPFTISLEQFVEATIFTAQALIEPSGTWQVTCIFDANGQAVLASLLDPILVTQADFIDWFGRNRPLTEQAAPALLVVVANNLAYLPFDANSILAGPTQGTAVIATGLSKAEAEALVDLLKP